MGHDALVGIMVDRAASLRGVMPVHNGSHLMSGLDPEHVPLSQMLGSFPGGLTFLDLT